MLVMPGLIEAFKQVPLLNLAALAIPFRHAPRPLTGNQVC